MAVEVPSRISEFALKVLREHGHISQNPQIHAIWVEMTDEPIEKTMQVKLAGDLVLKDVPVLDPRSGDTVYVQRWVRGPPKSIEFTYDTIYRLEIFNAGVKSYNVSISEDMQGILSMTECLSEAYSEYPGKLNLRVASINLWNHNHWIPRLDVLKSEIRSMNADVIAFQEVRSKKLTQEENAKGRIQIMDLLDLLFSISGHKWFWSFEPAMNFIETSSGTEEIVEEGLAIFSRYPILSSNALKLSWDRNDPSDFHQRLCQKVFLHLPSGDTVQVLNTHVSLSESARKRTLHEIASFADPVFPAILVGDFNAEEDDVKPILSAAGFDDCWEMLRPNEVGLTFNSWNMTKRIDFVFFRDQKDRRVIPESIELHGMIPVEFKGLKDMGGVSNMNNKLFPSDHSFLVLHVALSSSSTCPVYSSFDNPFA